MILSEVGEGKCGPINAEIEWTKYIFQVNWTPQFEDFQSYSILQIQKRIKDDLLFYFFTQNLTKIQKSTTLFFEPSSIQKLITIKINGFIYESSIRLQQKPVSPSIFSSIIILLFNGKGHRLGLRSQKWHNTLVSWQLKETVG